MGSLIDSTSESASKSNELKMSNKNYVYYRELTPGTDKFTDDRARGDDGKQYRYYTYRSILTDQKSGDSVMQHVKGNSG